MKKIRRWAIYNLDIDNSDIQIASRTLWWPAASLLALLLLLAPVLRAADWALPESQLAQNIITVTGPGAVALDITNRSSLSQTDVDAISREVRARLEALGLRFVNPDQAAATVKISLSEDLQNYVWVAEIHQGAAESSVVMVSTARSGAPVLNQETSRVVVHKALLWSQPQQILDVAVMDGNPTDMAVLDANQVSLYRLQGGRWQVLQALPISHVHPWPRDLRGRLVLSKDHLFDVYLPGVFCRSTANLPLALDCTESDDPWPVGAGPVSLNAFFTPSRNYFTGALALGKQTAAPPFYSAAPLPRDNYTLWVFAAVDGSLHLLDGMTDQERLPGWGSDIASVRGPCGTNSTVLAASGGEGTGETLRAYDVPDRDPMPVSPALEFHGPITALWTETNGTMAIAISRNPETRDYEAFRLSLTCGQ